jgi:hypothetical protein
LGICGLIALAMLPANGGQTVTLKVTPGFHCFMSGFVGALTEA